MNLKMSDNVCVWKVGKTRRTSRPGVRPKSSFQGTNIVALFNPVGLLKVKGQTTSVRRSAEGILSFPSQLDGKWVSLEKRDRSWRSDLESGFYMYTSIHREALLASHQTLLGNILLLEAKFRYGKVMPVALNLPSFV